MLPAICGLFCSGFGVSTWLRYCTWYISTGIYSYVSCCLVEDECEPNCDGSCITSLFTNREEGRRHQESLTKDWHEKLITMTTKHSFVRGKKEYTVTASEIRHAVLQQRQHVSISIIRTQCPMTVLHHAVIEGRVDVIRVGKYMFNFDDTYLLQTHCKAKCRNY